jgi:exopolyphosphatase/pppGpp-phosphohydrolase
MTRPRVVGWPSVLSPEAPRYYRYSVVTRQALRAALDAIAAGLAGLDGQPSPDALIALGGAVTNLAAVKHGLATYDPDIVQGTVLDRSEIDRQIDLYRTRSIDERRTIVGLQPQRADTILAGACIARTVMAKLDRESLTVSDRGLRHGLLIERFGPSALAARCRHRDKPIRPSSSGCLRCRRDQPAIASTPHHGSEVLARLTQDRCGRRLATSRWQVRCFHNPENGGAHLSPHLCDPNGTAPIRSMTASWRLRWPYRIS